MEEQSFREFISGLSDREARKLSGESWAEPARGAKRLKVQRGARMPGQRRAGKLVKKYFSQALFDFKRMDSHSISPKFSGKILYILSKPRICFLGSKDETVLF